MLKKLGSVFDDNTSIFQLPFELLYYPLDTWKARLQYKSIHGVDNGLRLRDVYCGFGIALIAQLALTFVAYRIANLMLVSLIYLFYIQQIEPSKIDILATLIVCYIPACILTIFREFNKIPHQVSNRLNPERNLSVFRGFFTTFAAMLLDTIHNVIDARLLILRLFDIKDVSYCFYVFLVVVAILPPLDLTKTAMLTYERNEHLLENTSCITEENKNCPFEILWSVARKRGFLGLYAGFIPIFIRMMSISIISRILVCKYIGEIC